ncbi:hypothetical protein AFA91_32890 [Mycolicibacterium goodii]|uniref:Uncharacterized protein n=1 Tax=Mycolicibacterium goodii TaxID=134601 RepID=A0A0K0XEU4_MYCGD|nr:hypothetical protein AFA91_32890 [Mycolicibacterium goodii]
MIHTWRVSTRLIVPKYRANEPAVGETLEFGSRLPVQARKYGGIPVAVRKLPGETPKMYLSDQAPSVPDQSREIVELVADVQVPAKEHSFTDAIERYSPVFGAVIDLLAFDMAAVPEVAGVEMVDISPPVSVGDERTAHRFSSPPFDRYMRSQEMLSIEGRQLGVLPESIDLDSKTSAALRWFVKALGTDVLHDQFIFLWIALEILCGMTPSISVEQTYRARCGHEIPECPECGKSTAKKVEGSTKKAFLQSYGVPTDKTDELWRMRQMMHGAISFDSKRVEGLSHLVPPLRAVVATDLKKRLSSDWPLVALQAGYIMHPAIAFGGSRPVTADEISPLMA